MKRILLGITLTSLLLGLSSAPAAPQAATQAPPPDLGLRAQILANISDTGGKLVQLADAIPADKYSWRPAPGVRSVSEVFMHVAVSNHFLASRIGSQMPQGITRDTEKTVTDKAQVVDWLKKSIDAVKQTIQNTPDADLTKAVRLFNRDNNTQGVMLQILSHFHEHLGQSIAYARSNGVAPPWSQQ